MTKCIKCGAEDFVRNGKVFGVQRYKCRQCGYQFTKESPHGKSIFQKLMTHDLYAAGLSMWQIANLVGVTPQTISRWLKKWHSVYQFEQGNDTLMYKVNSSNILDCLNIFSDEEYVLLNNRLPTGTKVAILIQTPKNH